MNSGFIVCILILALGSIGHADSTDLTPQQVVDRVLSNGLESKIINLDRELEELPLAQALGVYDWQLNGLLNYELSQAESLTQLTNKDDRTLNWDFGVSKKLPLGADLGLSYKRTSQSIFLNQFAQASGFPELRTLDVLTLEWTQNLWKNAFGLADRKSVASARLQLDNASLTEVEDLEEQVLTGLDLYWNTYVTKEMLKQSLEAKAKYEEVTRTIQRKRRLGFANPGELSQAQAELEAQLQLTKRNSAAYLNSLDQLSTALQWAEAPSDLTFIIENKIPDLPTTAAVDIKTLRAYEIAAQQVKVSEYDLDVTRSKHKPQLDLLAQSAFTGADEAPTRASTDVFTFSKPIYFVGIELSYPLDSKLRKGEIAHRKAQLNKSQLQLSLAVDQLKDNLALAEREVKALYQVATSSNRAVEFLSQAVKEMEKAYRQGRQDITLFIQVYNKFLESQTDMIRAIGEYHMALNRLAAARDELVVKSEAKKDL